MSDESPQAKASVLRKRWMDAVVAARCAEALGVSSEALALLHAEAERAREADCAYGDEVRAKGLIPGSRMAPYEKPFASVARALLGGLWGGTKCTISIHTHDTTSVGSDGIPDFGPPDTYEAVAQFIRVNRSEAAHV